MICWAEQRAASQAVKVPDCERIHLRCGSRLCFLRHIRKLLLLLCHIRAMIIFDFGLQYARPALPGAQKQLQELSSNGDMTLEEKMKKRQEIQQQISGLLH